MRLQGKLLLSIVPAIAVSLATLGVVVYGKLSEGIARDQRVRMDVAMERVQAASLAYVDMNELNARLFGDAEPIADYFRAVAEAPERSERAEAAVRSMFRRMQRRVPDYKELRLLSRDGRELIRVADDGLVNRSESEARTPWFQQVGHNWSAALHTQVMQHPDDDSLVLMIARPIEQADAGDEGARPTQHLRGYLAIAARLDFLNREVASRSFGESSRILVLDESGKAVFDAQDPGDEPVDQARSTSARKASDGVTLAQARRGAAAGSGARSALPRVMRTALERALARQNADAPGHIDVGGRTFTVYQRPLFGTMTIAAIVPDTASQRLAAGVAKSVATVTLISIVGATVLFYALLRVLLLRPIRNLQRSAVEIERGEHGRLLMASRRNDELGELGTAFHRMHRRMQESMREVQTAHDRTERLAFEDRLTGRFNRLWLMTRLDERIASGRTGRTEAHRFAVLLVNPGGFKRINERFGLDVGDSLLREIAGRLEQCASGCGCTAESAVVARLGGDEFVVAIDAVDDAERVAGCITEALARPIDLGGQLHATRANIGMAVYPDDAATVHDLLRCADLALGTAKHGERGFQRYDQSIRDGIEYRQLLEVELRNAVQEGVLELQYQPQINVASGRIQGVEALLRWRHAELGFISPEVFIPIAEQTGLIATIGRQVMRAACDQWSVWQQQGIAPERVSINVSPRQFQLGDVVAEVREELERRDMPAAALEVELTESGVANADEELVAALAAFRKMGVRVALDDFGKGISTLGALAALPIDTLKIDRSFVTDVDTQPRTEKVLAATLALIDSLGLEGVAEGVETEAEFRWLQAHDCCIVQGYFFSRPLWGPDMTERLREQCDQKQRKAA